MDKGKNYAEIFQDATVLLTGGTGSFGTALVDYCIRSKVKPKKLIIFSRDELKQYEMQQRFSPEKYTFLRYFIGDIRDIDRLKQAMFGVDYVIHAAAMKQVPASEYNPFECIKTNVLGGENVISAAIHNGVKKVIALSTDKAVNPVNLYGATKLCSDKLFVAANYMSAHVGTRFSVVRYGNVVGSRGSVVPLFRKLIADKSRKTLPITDERMTRFWITLEQGVEFVLKNFQIMRGGEVFVPKIPSMKVTDLARSMAPNHDFEFIGIRPGEKLHEAMCPRDEAANVAEFDDFYVIQPRFEWWDKEQFLKQTGAKNVPEDFEYSSEKNTVWLTSEKLHEMIDRN